MDPDTLRLGLSTRRHSATQRGECIDVVNDINLVTPFGQRMGQAANRLPVAAKVTGRIEGRHHCKAQTSAFACRPAHSGMLPVMTVNPQTYATLVCVLSVIGVCQNTTRTNRPGLHCNA